MKVTLLVCTLLCMSIRGNQERFLEANREYMCGNYAAALHAYESIKKTSPAIWYNKGNCLYALGKNIEAVACWRHAQKMTAQRWTNKKILRNAAQNINLVHKQQSVRRLKPWLMRIVEPFQLFSLYGSLFMWQLLLLLFLIITMLLIIFFTTRKVLLGFSTGALLFVALLLYERNKVNVCQHVLITTERPLCIGPDENFAHCGSVSPLLEMTVIGKKDSWYKVSDNKHVGWVPKESVILI